MVTRRQIAASGLVLLVGLAFAAALDGTSASTDSLASDPSTVLFETFEDGWEAKWVHSTDEKYTGRFAATEPEDWPHPAIKVPEKSKHYGITTLLPEALDPSAGLVVQYMVKYADAITCGGAYVKLVTAAEGFQAEQLKDDTPYSIMFGPDKCGNPGKVHLILRHKNLATGTVVEHHLKDPPTPQSDSSTHLYTLQITPQNTFEIWVDGESKASGSLLEKLEPPIVPPKEIADPTDIKPADWVDNDEMSDPAASKPEDWDERKEVEDEEAFKPDGWLDDEPALVLDPQASRPEDWDDEEDGDWAAPQIANPKCLTGECGVWTRPTKRNPDFKGPWSAPLVPNPEYEGPWVQRTIPNPEYAEDDAPLTHLGAIAALAVEIWTVDEGYTFGGFLVGSDIKAADKYRDDVFKPLQAAEKKVATDKMEAAAAERKAKSDAAAAEADSSKPALDIIHRVAQSILAFFNRPSVKKVKPFVLPFLSALEAAPEVIAGIAGASVLLILYALTRALFGKRAPARGPTDAAGQAKKEDTTAADDSADEPEPVPAAAASPVKKAKSASGTPKKGAKPEPASEISAAEPSAEEEEEEEAPKATRRRTPRAE